jgi:hypothetical protein
VIYLYAIGDPQPGAEAVRAAGLAGFVRRDVPRSPAPEPAALVSHDRVVAALAQNGAVLPVRFGTVVPAEDDVRKLLVERRDELRSRLEHVRGRVEMGVRAMWGAPEPGPSPCTGRDFMQAKLERHAAARRAADELHGPLAALAADSVLTLCPREDTAFSAAYLVERADAARFSERAKGVSVTGPWPPYSFSG